MPWRFSFSFGTSVCFKVDHKKRQLWFRLKSFVIGMIGKIEIGSVNWWCATVTMKLVWLWTVRGKLCTATFVMLLNMKVRERSRFFLPILLIVCGKLLKYRSYVLVFNTLDKELTRLNGDKSKYHNFVTVVKRYPTSKSLRAT